MHVPRKDEVRIVPLGGLGQIGMNCMAIEEEGGIVVVDGGIEFPEDDLVDDVVHHLFSYI
jgi:ribonuclease J